MVRRVGWSLLVVGMAVGGVFGGASPAVAVSSVSFGGGVLTVRGGPYKNFAVSCSAGQVMVNGIGVAGGAACGAVVSIDISIDDGAGIVASNKVDLRGVTRVLFPRVVSTRVDTFNGNDVVYGSEVNDVIDGGGLLIGGKGDDRITAWIGVPVVNSEVRGGDGNDVLQGGPGVDVFDGGAGNDTILGNVLNDAQGPGEVLYGRAGNDTITPSSGDQSTVYAGAGDDLVRAGFAQAGVVSVIDLGDGTDELRLFRSDALVTVDNPGSDRSIIRARLDGGSEVSVRRAETMLLSGTVGDRSDVVMQELTAVRLGGFAQQGTIRVPSDVWTRTATGVSSPGVQPVTWQANQADAVTIVRNTPLPSA